MIEIEPGHIYKLNILDARPEEPFSNLVFVKRMGNKYPGNTTMHAGTNCQEVLRACASRLLFLQQQLPHELTHVARLSIEGAIHLLEERAALRHGRDTNFSIHEAVHGKFCNKCGHIKCQGDCHA